MGPFPRSSNTIFKILSAIANILEPDLVVLFLVTNMFVSRDDAAKIVSSLGGNLLVVGAVSSIVVDGKECKIRSRQSKCHFP